MVSTSAPPSAIQGGRGAGIRGVGARDCPGIGGYAASARCRPELGTGSKRWLKPEPSAPL